MVLGTRMKLFRCPVCDNVIHFENRTCGRCKHRLGYVPELGNMTALEPAGDGTWAPRRTASLVAAPVEVA